MQKNSENIFKKIVQFTCNQKAHDFTFPTTMFKVNSVSPLCNNFIEYITFK